MPAANRTATREVVVQTVFEAEFRDLDESASQAALEQGLAEVAAEVGKVDSKFAAQLMESTFQHIEAIKAELTKYAPDWPYAKISRIDRVILLVAIAELKFLNAAVPPAVTLNEYVEIAKNYSDDSSRRFVNGVLSSIKKGLESK